MHTDGSVTVAVAYHSRYGHTEHQAQTVTAGARQASGSSAVLHNVADLNDELWAGLAASHAIFSGAPTYMGESGASDVHREKLASSDAETTVLTRLFSGRHARGILNALIRDLGPEENAVPHYPVQNGLMQPLQQAAARLGNSDYVNLWAGQAAPLSRKQSAAEYLQTLL